MQSFVLIGLGILKTSFVVISGKLFDTRGRRPLMLLSLGGEKKRFSLCIIFVSIAVFNWCHFICVAFLLLGMALVLLMQSINFMADETNGVFAICCLALYLIFFSLGMGPGKALIQ